MRFLILLLSLTLTFPISAAEGFLTTEPGVNIYWRELGDGPPVILPGGFLFGNDLDSLAGAHRLILYDMRHRGRSSDLTDPGQMTIEGDLRDLEAIRRHFGIERFSTIGYSYLGKMVALYAIEHPERVERIVQIGPVPMVFSSAIPTIHDNSLEVVTDPEALDSLRAMRANGQHESDPRGYCEANWLVLRPRLVGRADLAARLESPCSMPNEWPVNLALQFRHHFASVQQKDVGPIAAREVRAPVLTIHGTKDRNAPYGAGREWAMMLADARLLTVEGGAHQVWVDDPAVIEDLRTFLSGRWPDRARQISMMDDPWLAQLRAVELLERVRRSATEAPDESAILSLEVDGTLSLKSQSRTAAPPWDDFPVRLALWIDAQNRRVAAEQSLEWPNFTSRYRTVSHLSDQPATSEVDLNSGRPVPPILDAEEHWLRQIQYVPALLVREMLQRPGSIRLTGIVRSGDEWLQSVEGEIGEARLTLFIGPADRIWQVQRLVASPLTGDSIERIELRGDQRISGFVVPERVRRFVDGDLVAELSIGEGPASDVSQFELGEVLPLVEEKVPPVQIERLADGVWRMGGIGGADYQSLAVIQDDELVLLETPRNLEAMRAAIEALRQEIGPLPVRTAVVTHHHFDHSGGVRFAMEEGARILVPRGTEELFGRIAAAPRTLEPDGAVVDPWSLSVRGVERMTLTPDRSGSVIELFSLGENEHAEGMLFAWIPEHGIVFQGDIFVHREEPEAARSQAVAFLLRLRELGLTPGRIVGVHGEIATLDDLERAVAAR